MNIEKWFEINTKDLTGKTVVITGATGGIGEQLCLYLAKLNANLILACRQNNKADNLIKRILIDYPNAKVKTLPLELTDFVSINNFIKKVEKVKIDYFIHNAGIYNVKRKETSAEIDNIFQVNFAAPYYITKELLTHFRKCKTKVIATSSLAHNYSKIDASDIEFRTRKKASIVYGNSKRFLTFALFELFKTETETTLAITHPGVTLTNITNHYHWSINWLVKIGIKLLFPSVKKATLHIIKALFEDCNYLEWIGPTKLSVWGKPKKTLLQTCSENERTKIFEIAEKYFNRINNNNNNN